MNGIGAWADKGIAGRGVLIDYADWAQEKGITYNPLSSHPVTVDEIELILAEREVTLHPGDILLIRTGKKPELFVMIWP